MAFDPRIDSTKTYRTVGQGLVVSGKLFEDRIKFVECFYPAPLSDQYAAEIRPNVGCRGTLQRFVKVANGLLERGPRARALAPLTVAQRGQAGTEIEMVGPSVRFRYLC